MSVILSGLLWASRFAVGACVFGFFKEMIPCVSYLLQRKKCRDCGEKISGRYFPVELTGGLLFVCCGAGFGYGRWGFLSPRGILAFAYLGILTMVALIDWNIRIIYDRFHIGIALLGIASLWLFPEYTLADRLIGAAVISLPMLALTLIAEGAFGGGDIKLMAVSGFLLAWRGIVAAMFIGVLAGGAYCIWMLARKKLARRDSFAFGPFLAFGLGIALFCMYGN